MNKYDPNSSLNRAILNRGESAHTGHTYTLGETARAELLKLFLTSEDKLDNITIGEYFSEEFFKSNF